MSMVASSTGTMVIPGNHGIAGTPSHPLLFTGIIHKVSKIEPREVTRLQPDWVTGVLITCFILFAWTQVFYSKRVRQVFQAPFSQRFINQLIRDGNLLRERISLTLGTVYFLSFALLLYTMNELTLKIRIPGFNDIMLYAAILVTCIVYLNVKVILIRIVGLVFKTRDTTYNYLLNMVIFALMSAPILMIALVLILFLRIPVLLFITISLLILIFLFRFSRGFFIGMSLTKFSYLLLFIYLCTLEILPLLVVAKALLSLANTAGG